MANFNRDIANKKVYVTSAQTMARNESDGSVDVIKGQTNKSVGISTGIEVKVDGINYIEVLRSNYLYLFKKNDVSLSQDVDLSYYYKEADKYLSTLLENQKEIAYQLSICSLLIKELGVKAEPYKGKLKYYFNRWKERNEEVDLYCQNIQTSSIQQFDNSLKEAGIGIVVSTGLVLIITAVVSVSFASLAWFCYYNESNESRKDARDIIELNKLLADLDEATKTKVFKIINEYGDENYKKGARKILMQNLTKSLKYISIFALCGFVLYKYINRND